MAGKLFVISGPSGAGLRDIVGTVFEIRSDVAAVMPVTSRKMKKGEQDGVGFRFYDLDGWKAIKENGDLIEETVFAGNNYGTSRSLVNEILETGKSVLLNVEVDRAAQIKKNMPESVCVYAEPSDREILKSRYSESARSRFEVDVRLQEADKQRAISGFCDARVNSDDPESAVKAICGIIDANI